MTEPDPLVDAVTAAAYVTHLRGQHCAPGTIWSWATRGHIRRHGRGRYDIREIDTWTRRQLMQELTEWLRAQLDARERELDEDERVARAAIADDGGQDGGFEDADWLTDPSIPTTTFGDAAAAMIRRFAVPRRVLRQVAAERADIDAKRRILDRLRGDDGLYRDDIAPGTAEPVIRLLALPMAGRDGYLDTWRPEQQPDMPT